MLEKIDTHFTTQQEPFKKALVARVRIPRICDEGPVQYPFGEAIGQALRTALQIAADLGFRTHYGAGCNCGYSVIGEGPIVGHLNRRSS